MTNESGTSQEARATSTRSRIVIKSGPALAQHQSSEAKPASTSKKSSNPWVVEAIKEMRPFTLVTWDDGKLNPIAVFNSTMIL